jgi:hypothetical protein
VSLIRPLEREDLPDVASLLELVFRSGTRSAPQGFAGYLERLFLDQPWADPEIPSLVYLDDQERLVGFLGSHVRRFRFDDRRIRVAVGGQLAVEPGPARKRAAGAFLLQRFLAGPQDLTMTDSASETVRRMWEGLGGEAVHLERMGWVRLFRPARFTAAFASRRRLSGRAGRLAVRLATVADLLATNVAGGALRTKRPDVAAEALTPELVLEHLTEITAGIQLRPDYDAAFLPWLLREVAAVRSHGSLSGSLVRHRDGRVLGWYLYYLQPGGISQVLQIAVKTAEVSAVIDHLFHHARLNGSAAVQGRLEPPLVEPLSQRHCLFHVAGYRVLLRSSEPDFLRAIVTGRALLSRLDGDWWISLSRGPFD